MVFLGANYITMLARLHILDFRVGQDSLLPYLEVSFNYYPVEFTEVKGF
ncbi:hypothetical protein NTGM5_790007 [Candidatus Nitrotoga sp. M5]|nr:hypothetical protein NTGM5_790007 [Candidatus Nitrotoga sp. M5]